MPEVYVVCAEFGRYTEHFLKGKYAAVGWIDDLNLSGVKSRDELYPIYRQQHPNDTSNVVIGQQVGQIARFLLEIKRNDYVTVPSGNTEILHYGVAAKSSYYYFAGDDGCPFRHRRGVEWNVAAIERSAFSVPFQNTIRSSLTVFKVNHERNFFETIGRPDLSGDGNIKGEFDYYTTVLNRILELDPKEFEILLTHLLTAFNRTNLELKRSFERRHHARQTPFNRTNLELKRHLRERSRFAPVSFNRTNLELKPAPDLLDMVKKKLTRNLLSSPVLSS